MAELISFVKPRQFLCVQNSYKFFNLGTGFNLSKGSMELEMNIGLWSSVFLNHYIAGSGARGVGAFEVGFDQNQPFQKQGLLCSVSPRLESELAGVHRIDRDIAAVEMFKSGEVFLRKGSSLNELKTAYPYAKDIIAATPDQAYDYFREEAFQVAFKVPSGSLPSVWVDLITKEGFSWNWYEDGLVLSNSKSAYYGIPPNYQHLSLKKLELDCEDNKLCGVSGFPSVYPTPVVRKTVQPAGDNWRRLICAFMLDPNAKNMKALTTDLDAHTEFLGMGKRSEYNPGSRKKKWTTLLIDEVSSGEDGACTFPALAQALDKVAGKGSFLVQFILLKKLAGQARIDHEKETIRYK